MTKYILRWWIYPSMITCFAYFLLSDFLSFLRDISLSRAPLLPIIFQLEWSFFFIGWGTIAFYFADWRLQDYLQKHHRLPVVSATILFGLANLIFLLVPFFVIPSWIFYPSVFDLYANLLIVATMLVLYCIMIILYTFQAKAISRNYAKET